MQNEWCIESNELANSLVSDFKKGPIIEGANRFLTEETVANLNGLKIQIFSNEHPPPHFRVIYAGDSANFTIKDCQKLNGGLGKWEKNIRKWHEENKTLLIKTWNETRPSNCPVGEYRE